MSLFPKIKNFFYNKSIQTFKVERSVHWCNLEEAKKIGLIVNLDDKNKEEVFDFVEEWRAKGKKVEVIVFSENEVNLDGYIVLNKKNVSWTGIPKLDLISDFVNTEFDLVLNFFLATNKSLGYVARVSRGSFKVGMYRGKEAICDLMIDKKGEKELIFSGFILNLEKILKGMRQPVANE